MLFCCLFDLVEMVILARFPLSDAFAEPPIAKGDDLEIARGDLVQ
jgi:hypothetical protein